MSFKTAICYFSGTGNSFDVTLELCKHLDIESIFYLPNLDKRKLEDFDEIIIVSPVYQFNIPKSVQDFIRNLTLDKHYNVVLNGAGIVGKSKSTVKKLFKESKLKLGEVHWVQMPSSFTILLAEPKSMIDSLLKRSKNKIMKIAGKIAKSEGSSMDYSSIKSIKRYVGYSTMSNNLSVSKDCSKCEKCIEICPNHNIHLYQGRIEFGDRCLGCLACYNRCEHVLYKNKKGETYFNPNVDFKLMK